MHKKLLFITIIFFSFILPAANAQRKIILGIIKDQHSEERIPYASVEFKNSKIGKSADSSGSFRFVFDNWISDTLLITDIGYEDYKIVIDPSLINGDTLNLPIY